MTKLQEASASLEQILYAQRENDTGVASRANVELEAITQGRDALSILLHVLRSSRDDYIQQSALVLIGHVISDPHFTAALGPQDLAQICHTLLEIFLIRQDITWIQAV
jgi:hypothetical protein